MVQGLRTARDAGLASLDTLKRDTVVQGLRTARDAGLASLDTLKGRFHSYGYRYGYSNLVS